MIQSKKDKRQKVKFSIRKKVSGTSERPRLAVLDPIKRFMLK